MSNIKVGDLVTGKDRSYERSIYRVTSINNDGINAMFEFIALRGMSQQYYLEKKGITIDDVTELEFTLDDFRVASNIDIAKATTGSHIKLLQLIDKLDIYAYDEY
jgi:hypothetical protein